MNTLRVASYNIRKAIGRDGKRDPLRIKRVIADMAPDIIALQEADFRFNGRKAIFDPTELTDRTGLVAQDVAPHAPGLGWHGNVLLTRADILLVSVEALALPGTEPRGAFIANLQTPLGPLRIIGTHLGLIPWQRKKQARILADYQSGQTVLLGDLNALGKSNGALSPIVKVFTTVNIGPSYPTRKPRFAFDRIFHDSSLQADTFGVVHTPLAQVASDHLPIFADLSQKR